MMGSEQVRDWDRMTGKSLGLEEWLAKVLDPKVVSEEEFLISYTFPTDQHADEYFATIDKRPEDEVVALLRQFLFPSCCFPQSDAHQYFYIRHLASAKAASPDLGPIRMMSLDELLKREHTCRLLMSIASDGNVPSWDGIRWALDLLPQFPRSAIDALDAYILAHAQLLPDGRFSGLSQSVAIIRAKFIRRHRTMLGLHCFPLTIASSSSSWSDSSPLWAMRPRLLRQLAMAGKM